MGKVLLLICESESVIAHNLKHEMGRDPDYPIGSSLSDDDNDNSPMGKLSKALRKADQKKKAASLAIVKKAKKKSKKASASSPHSSPLDKRYSQLCKEFLASCDQFFPNHKLTPTREYLDELVAWWNSVYHFAGMMLGGMRLRKVVLDVDDTGRNRFECKMIMRQVLVIQAKLDGTGKKINKDKGATTGKGVTLSEGDDVSATSAEAAAPASASASDGSKR